MTHPHEGLQERALREALKKCRQQFEYYVQQHMAKTSPDMDKAATNQEFVELCEFALSSTPPVPQDQGLRDALEKKLIEAQAIVSCMAHRPSCVLGDDMCLCGLSQLDRVLRLPAETTLPQQAATDEGDACPFCGCADTFVERSDFSSSYVVCNNCSARGPVECQEDDDEDQPGKDAAIRSWSKRSPFEALAQIEHARSVLVARHLAKVALTGLKGISND